MCLFLSCCFIWEILQHHSDAMIWDIRGSDDCLPSVILFITLKYSSLWNQIVLNQILTFMSINWQIQYCSTHVPKCWCENICSKWNTRRGFNPLFGQFFWHTSTCWGCIEILFLNFENKSWQTWSLKLFHPSSGTGNIQSQD